MTPMPPTYCLSNRWELCYAQSAYASKVGDTPMPRDGAQLPIEFAWDVLLLLRPQQTPDGNVQLL